MKKQLRILVDEEFGYRTWIWTPQISDRERFLKWFENVDQSTRMDSFFNPTILPGLWQEVSDDEEIDLKSIDGHAYLHYDNDCFVSIGEKTARWTSSNREISNTY